PPLPPERRASRPGRAPAGTTRSSSPRVRTDAIALATAGSRRSSGSRPVRLMLLALPGHDDRPDTSRHRGSLGYARPTDLAPPLPGGTSVAAGSSRAPGRSDGGVGAERGLEGVEGGAQDRRGGVHRVGEVLHLDPDARHVTLEREPLG